MGISIWHFVPWDHVAMPWTSKCSSSTLTVGFFFLLKNVGFVWMARNCRKVRYKKMSWNRKHKNISCVFSFLVWFKRGTRWREEIRIRGLEFHFTGFMSLLLVFVLFDIRISSISSILPQYCWQQSSCTKSWNIYW